MYDISVSDFRNGGCLCQIAMYFFTNIMHSGLKYNKKGAIREATMAKYLMTQKWVEKLVPKLRVSELTRTALSATSE